ncbi:MAG: Prolipoprotein diacylglyceryl transferase [Candidatus Magasanikbacteria bacterium GW2011_GWA2_56_11]|uniref:Phosphatidylglycerol--prolipoprotein diacylglyceryl transferase n=1 Tax=Candidatus Magasanikbacteria bacterium GW2011_GWA2_56_11 TaxID=1619044 RepID=A0A0G1YEY7_9BACT|nr:MAG: Prolipoprotein diacylglyceryl transferase [Candidatus Magasanikbacteria bacterium GW2011_GWA2_56_11]
MFPWFQYTVIYLGPIPIRVWGLFVAAGMLVALTIIYRRGRRLGMNGEHLLDHALWMIVLGIIFARLFHVFFYEPAYFLAQPAEMVKIWHGGLSSYGGFLGAVLGFLWYAKRRGVGKTSWIKIADLMSFAALFGWIVGRLGCVMIHDHLGRPCNCWLAIQTPDGPRLEMSILEILGLLPLAAVFVIARQQKKPDGWFLGVMLVYYGLLRFTLDFYRAVDLPNSDARYLGLTPAQYFSIIMAGFGISLLLKIRQKT